MVYVLQHLYAVLPVKATAKCMESCSTTLKSTLSIGLVLGYRLLNMLVVILLSVTSPRVDYLLRRVAWRRQLGMSMLWMVHVGLVCTVFLLKSKADEDQAASAAHESAREDALNSCFAAVNKEMSVEEHAREAGTVRKRTRSLDGTSDMA